jgi:hypothetical protein
VKYNTLRLIAILILGVRSAEAQVPCCGSGSNYLVLVQNSCRMVLCSLFDRTFGHFGGRFPFAPRADGGGDGGGGGDCGGSGGDGGGDSGGTGDGGGGDGEGGAGGTGNGSGEGDSGDSDGPSGDTAAVGTPGEQGDGNGDSPAQSDPTTNAANESATLSPTAPTSTIDTSQSAPNFGPGAPGRVGDSSGRLSQIFATGVLPRRPPGGTSLGGVGSDVRINAVIVSGAPNPWEAIGKSPRVRNVIVTGGIIALGESAIINPHPELMVGAAQNPPAWLKFKPDLRYLNGSLFPPVVPNVIDIRTISYAEEATENPN